MRKGRWMKEDAGKAMKAKWKEVTRQFADPALGAFSFDEVIIIMDTCFHGGNSGVTASTVDLPVPPLL